MQVALRDGSELGHRPGGHVLDFVACLLQQFSCHVSGYVLSCPFVDGDLDRLGGINDGLRTGDHHNHGNRQRFERSNKHIESSSRENVYLI